MIVKLLTEHHLVFLSLKGGCIGSSESIHIKMPACTGLFASFRILKASESSLLTRHFFTAWATCNNETSLKRMQR